MDLLREEILKKRKNLADESGGKKFFKRSDIDQRKIEKLRDEERRDLELKAHRKSAAAAADGKASQSSAPSELEVAAISDSKSVTDETLILSNQEVIRRLRMLKQPITLFGEDDKSRLDRFNNVLKEGLFDVDDSEITEGQTNDFLRDLSKRKKSDTNNNNKKKSRDGDDDCSDDVDSDFELLKADFDDLCDEDKIIVFFKKLIIERKEEIDAERLSTKRSVATFQQCARDLTPLFNLCRNKCLHGDIRRALMVMVNHCRNRDYLAAMDHYIKLAIGNAPWPIGVTMVGIHERSAREKIHTSSVAHIMNDETTRKYLQSVKRLMTFCQRSYPAMPSKSVEFNSLANGSDLESLLAQESLLGG
ncbi:unnamed protein product [Cochlearia groenlandica]